ncbi:MAG: cell division/cell wall cluster transcriptional repressor MraZ [Candidatus Nealsonbacteria bacterium CG23_combo_of_CG06-09_8_20_14_all_40_13]|uniref:Transcriptional regulator MraZ n=1 Tax=Candidatus Nealsonbacteria bacterium CG23_combo_of_CG06-09_8_20_14_all_40_13 TaxID=1974724 RepID=A0A2G9YQL0_9BACT|nr:MAG: cell division/cell wall cluster transcriptional repressor MraZ [Candidatus Nealsonbacteria bacterium CG23_combo_of_CG06-09_8_20_14_all_40_13]PIR71352.1 MAG: cell division/cell wall cluster transcriptional repressor MraZ [Candidatus Nealsonbacteria bacterium CG10_big_fil_rev_8_21_14_0_10_40_24]PIU43206.1 MAG: cell division/cell wall cluster transcriptional repressor MraZ [Candidatus Nealsonbacteria bacterium CG07_land_8_20_14_0_80_40_10]
MFIGEFHHVIDPKGRVAIPSKFRLILGKDAFVTRGIDNCLFVYPKEEWGKLAQKLSQLPISDIKARAFSRLMLSGAGEVEFDRQGRILLPGYLRDYAGLKNTVCAVGVYNRIEIWDEAKWNEYKGKMDKETEAISEHLANLGV